MAAYRRVYGFGHLQADYRGPGSALKSYARYLYLSQQMDSDRQAKFIHKGVFNCRSCCRTTHSGHWCTVPRCRRPINTVYGRRPPLNYYSSVAAYNRRRLSGSSSEPTSLRQKRLYYARAPLGQRL